MPPLKSGESKDIKLEMIIPSGLAWRTYQVYMNFNVKGENIGNEIMTYMNRVSEFRMIFIKNMENIEKKILWNITEMTIVMDLTCVNG